MTRLRSVGTPFDRAEFAAALWLRGVPVDRLTYAEFAILSEAVSDRYRGNSKETATEDIIADEASRETPTYSILLKRLRILWLEGNNAAAADILERIARLYPNPAGESYSPVCDSEHREVLRWLLKT